MGQESLPTNNYKIGIPSNKESILQIDAFIDDLFKKVGVSDDLAFKIRLCVIEAVNNAIFHGNNQDVSKQVELSANHVPGEKIAFTVCDEGCGYRKEVIADPTSDAFIDKPNGRGLFLIKELCDCVEYTQNGSRVDIEFSLNGPCQ